MLYRCVELLCTWTAQVQQQLRLVQVLRLKELRRRASLVPRVCRPSDPRRSSGLRRLSLGLSDALRRLSLHGDLHAAAAASPSSPGTAAGPAERAGALPRPGSPLWEADWCHFRLHHNARARLSLRACSIMMDACLLLTARPQACTTPCPLPRSGRHGR